MDGQRFGSWPGIFEPTFVISAAADLVCKSAILLLIVWGAVMLLRRQTGPTAVARVRCTTLESHRPGILDGKKSRHPAGRAMMGCVLFLVAVVVFGVVVVQLTVDQGGSADREVVSEAVEPDVAEPAVDEQPQQVVDVDGGLLIEVVAADEGDGLGEVRLVIEMDDQSLQWDSDGAGLYRLSLPEEGPVGRLVIVATATGRVPQQITFEPVDGQVTVPQTLRIELEAGHPIGGLVQNPLGKALRGTKVHLRFDRQETAAAGYVVTIPDQQVQTDKWGWWRCDTVPQNLDCLQMKFTDPHYESDTDFDSTTEDANEKLKQKIHTRIMQQVELRSDGVV